MVLSCLAPWGGCMKRLTAACLSILVLNFASARRVIAAQTVQVDPEVIYEVNHDTSPPLTEMPVLTPEVGSSRAIPLRLPRAEGGPAGATAAAAPDSVVQLTEG